ncbi:MAG: hydrogenase [Acidimicrobiales bacterium]|nr:hydrogenase [Acidimicrobiales bacterium]
MVLLMILIAPLLGGVISLLFRKDVRIAWISVATNAFVLGVSIWLAFHVVTRGVVLGAGGFLRADALSAFMVIVIGAISLMASWLGISTMAHEVASNPNQRAHSATYGVLVQLFIVAMVLAVLAANVAVMWVAVEATTVVTTFLVGHRRTKGALEASWKYIVICSVGIALAFFGTVLVYLCALRVGGHSAAALNWTSLVSVARHLNPSVMRLGFGLVVLGYGTKVGLVPMHSWLPDAHSQAPAPISALMSGVLITVAFYAILRFKAIVDLAVGPNFSRTLLVIVALLSLALAASLLITQHDYKRMLAYHSIEHMGLIALGAAAGIPLAIAAVLLHILGHGLAKSILFLASGEIMAAEGTTEISEVHALLERRPILGGVFGVGLIALLGLPPFSLFSSELLMARAEFQVGLGWAAVASIVAMVIIFFAVVGHARHMLLGANVSDEVLDKPPNWVSGPLVSGLVILALIGVLAWPLSSLLSAAAHVVTP